ncbi:unnamed protein product [Orchesella dallaii]|uniref:Protein transport protein sec16 n=1 Tax=Orchesella dallaii TaxID=48710 RepID=A0ABP1S4Q5_9HEXA
MAESYNPPVAGTAQPAEDNEQRIDGDGQEVNALRFMGLGAGGGGAPVPPPPAITPVTTGVSQPLQPQHQQQPPQPPQAPLQPPQAPQHQQQMPAPPGYDYSDPATTYGSMQIPPGPMSGPYGMPGQMPGVLPGAAMMMIPQYPNYMYPNPYFMAPGAYQPMQPQPAPSTKSQQLVAYLNVLRVKEPKLYRDWHKKYTVHMRNPERIPFPQVPGYQSLGGQTQTLPTYGRQRKSSTRSSVNGDPYRQVHNESFADFSHGANTSMSSYPRSHDRQRPSQSGRTSVNGDYRPHPEIDGFEIDGADISSLSQVGGHSLMNSSHYTPNERDRPPTQSGRSSTVGEPYRPEDVYGSYVDQQPDSLNYDSSYRFQPISEQVREPSPRRMTPLKFNTLHSTCSLFPWGALLKVRNAGQGLEFVKLKQIVSHLPEYKELESFRGPLIQGVTHKNTVIQFCKRKIKNARSSSDQLDRDNFILLWEFLMLMIKQNGHVVGSDIAELLMTAVEGEKKAIVVEEVRDDVEGKEDEEETDASVPVEPSPPPVAEPKDEEKLVEQFCEHLLYGHKNDALDFAMDNSLWGHALFFASKMDERSYGHVLARFANGIPLNSPLQTLYHIMCGKQPTSVTSCADDNFGDWKPHLAMLLSNSGSRPDVEQKAILTLGDTLASRNHLYAAQFCYLMGREEFRKDSRLGPLLGYSAEKKNLLEATQMTEVYEFALKLQDDPHLSLGLSFLENKLDYARSLLNLGFVQEALSYCEEVTKTLKSRKIEAVEFQLCTSTLHLAERIALADESGNAITTWVADLKKITEDPSAFCGSSRKMSVLSSQEQTSEVTYPSQPQQIPPVETYDPNLYNQQQQILPPDIGIVSQNQYDAGPPTAAVISNNNVVENTASSTSLQENSWSTPPQMNGGLHISQSMYDVTNQLQQMNLNVSTNNPPGAYNNNMDGNYPSYDGGYTSGAGYDKQPNPPTDNNNYWYNQNQPYNSQPPVGMNDNSAPYKEQEYNHTSAVKTELASNPLPPQGSGSKKSDDGKKKGKENKGTLDGNQQQQPGLFSRIFRFSLKPNNQMKLPDDKNPTIVWDENKKRWVNTAADGDDDTAPAGPPPKDSDLMRGPMPNGPMSMPPPNRNMQPVPPSANNMQAPQPNMSYQQAPAALHSLPNQMPTMNQPSQSPGMMMNVPLQQPQQQPSNSDPMIPGMPQVSNNSMNKYKLQKGRNLKNSYVDVLNPNSSRSPSEPPQLPINNVSAPQVPNLFIPPPTNSGGDGPVSFLTAPSEEVPPGQDNSQVQAPPMFNPAQFQNPGYPQGQ